MLRPLRGARASTKQPGFIEVEACGAGILLIQRACAAAMLKAMPQISDAKAKTSSPLAKNLERLIRAFDVLTVDGTRLSEDFAFCHRWRRHCGGEVWASIAHEIAHIGLHQFRARYLDNLPASPQLVVKLEGTTVTGRLVARAQPKSDPTTKH